MKTFFKYPTSTNREITKHVEVSSTKLAVLGYFKEHEMHVLVLGSWPELWAGEYHYFI